MNELKAKYFFEGIAVPSISKTQLTKLNAPITELDIAKTISNLANSKAPGPDGFPAEFYKIMKESITTSLTKLYTHV